MRATVPNPLSSGVWEEEEEGVLVLGIIARSRDGAGVREVHEHRFRRG